MRNLTGHLNANIGINLKKKLKDFKFSNRIETDSQAVRVILNAYFDGRFKIEKKEDEENEEESEKKEMKQRPSLDYLDFEFTKKDVIKMYEEFGRGKESANYFVIVQKKAGRITRIEQGKYRRVLVKSYIKA